MSALSSPTRLLLTLLTATLIATAFPTAALAVDTPAWRRPHDYYATDAESRHLLTMVEGHHLQQGTDKMARGEYGYAKQDFDFILRYFPNDPKALLLMGELAVKTGKPQDATHYFETAIKMFPDRAPTHTVYGVFLHRTGKLKQAIIQYKESLKLDPGSAETNYDLGLAYLTLRDYALANQHAHAAYRLGYPLPGLREKLQRAGKWEPITPITTDSHPPHP
ncbi:MAG: tetratricopeptide repeat protein [Gammaproteobacteria bacterium]|nr:tetratricopeptide repeat protein [Gammaproteobacteria bacterium]